MPFQIIQQDLTRMKVDAIVNTTNPEPSVGYGVDYGIHHAAGPQLLAARKELGTIALCDAAITKGFDLPAKHVIHTVCPPWEDGRSREAELLHNTYLRCLTLAAEHKCRSVAFPLMSAGNLGFPKEVALQTAVSAITKFLMEQEMMVYLTVFNREAVAVSEKLFQSVERYIDEQYVQEKSLLEQGYASAEMLPTEEFRSPPAERQRRRRRPREDCLMERKMCAPMAAGPISMADLSQLLDHTDAGFSETLLQLIDRSGKTDVEVYKRANIDRKLFSKIRSNPNYRPSKPTVLAFAIALELNLQETEMLLGRAGLALSRANKQDIVVEFFIKNKNYNIFELNNMLFAFDLPPLGNITE